MILVEQATAIGSAIVDPIKEPRTDMRTVSSSGPNTFGANEFCMVYHSASQKLLSKMLRKESFAGSMPNFS